MVNAGSLGRSRRQQLLNGSRVPLLHEEPLRNGYRNDTKPPPLKRRRTLPSHHNSTTASDSDQQRDTNDGRGSRTRMQPQHTRAINAHGRRAASASYPVASSSSEHDNPNDDDYTTNEEAGLAKDQPFQPTGSHQRNKMAQRRDLSAFAAPTRGQSHQLAGRAKSGSTARTSSNGTRRSNASSNAQNHAPSAASETSQDNSDDQSWSDQASSSSVSSFASPKALSPVEGNIMHGKRTHGAKGKTATQRINGRYGTRRAVIDDLLIYVHLAATWRTGCLHHDIACRQSSCYLRLNGIALAIATSKCFRTRLRSSGYPCRLSQSRHDNSLEPCFL